MVNEYTPELDAAKHPNWFDAPEGRRFSIQKLYLEINKYANDHPEISDVLVARMKLQYLKSYDKYQSSWEDWSIKRLEMEALDELADYHNYRLFRKLKHGFIHINP